MTSRPIRLGMSFGEQNSVAKLAVQASRAEQIGFDAVLAIDHLGIGAPLPSLVAMAAAAPSIRVGTHVINASFHRPALLARELATVDSATGGRFDIGLGAGYAEEEFAAAGLPFSSHTVRLELLLDHISEIRTRLSDSSYTPRAVQKPPPILVGGMGEKLLSAAAKHADIVAIATLGDETRLVEQVAVVTSQAGPRLDDIEIAVGFFQVSLDDSEDLSVLRQMMPTASEKDLRRMVCLLDGSVPEAAERVRHFHDDLGISYFTFHKTPATSWRTYEKLVDALR